MTVQTRKPPARPRNGRLEPISGDGAKPGRSLAATNKLIKQKEAELKLKLLESSIGLYGDSAIWQDKAESEIGWTTVTIDGDEKKPSHTVYASHEDLKKIIQKFRTQETTNPYARNVYQNRVNYIVGSGTKYKVYARNKSRRSQFAKRVGTYIESFLIQNNWDEMEQEIVHRTDRDGECFVRLFPQEGGRMTMRIVEPFQVKTPDALVNKDNVYYGIRFEEDDVETPVLYYVFYGTGKDDYDKVEAKNMVHFKGNVDRNSVRGLPVTHSAYDDLEFAKKIKRNMAVVTTVQASIALIRKHGNAKPEVVRNFVGERGATGFGQGQTPMPQLEYAGTPRILDVTQGYDYEFPAVQIAVDKMVSALQACLRAAAASLQMPEFMISSDASGANYSSSMVSEGPAVRSFGRAQNFFAGGFIEILARSVLWAIRVGEIVGPEELSTPTALLEVIEIRAKSPGLTTKKNKEETENRQMLRQEGVLSVQKWCEEENLDYEEVQDEIEAHLKRVIEKFPQAKVTLDPLTGKVSIEMPEPAPTVPGGAAKPGAGGAKRPAPGASKRPRSAKPRPSGRS